jgi:hypothetical protein
MLAKEAQTTSVNTDRSAASAAVGRILECQKDFRLDGLRVRDLIDEGRWS